MEEFASGIDSELLQTPGPIRALGSRRKANSVDFELLSQLEYLAY